MIFSRNAISQELANNSGRPGTREKQMRGRRGGGPAGSVDSPFLEEAVSTREVYLHLSPAYLRLWAEGDPQVSGKE